MREISRQHLPGIKAIGWLDAGHLTPNVCLYGITGQEVGIIAEIHPIDFCADADCTCKTSKSGSRYSDTATLKFFSAIPITFDGLCNVAFVVTDTENRTWLIGSKEHPNATIDITYQHAAPSSGRSGYQYEVSHVACKSLIPCKVFS